MNEAEWMQSTDPARLLRHLEAVGKRPSDSRLRCWVEACRELCDCNVSREAELTPPADWWATIPDRETCRCTQAARADLLRHVCGNPFRPAVTRGCEACGGSGRKIASNLYHGRWLGTCQECNGAGWLDAMPWERCERCRCTDNCKERWDKAPEYRTFVWCEGCSSWMKKRAPCEACSGRKQVLRWPAECVRLAEACEAPGRVKCPVCRKKAVTCDLCSCSGTVPASPPYFALADALIEAGYPTLAEHFQTNPCPVSYAHMPHDYCDGSPSTTRATKVHPRGCYFLDLILNRE